MTIFGFVIFLSFIIGFAGLFFLKIYGGLRYLGAFLLSISLGLPALFVSPTMDSDLSRYFNIMDEIKGINSVNELMNAFSQIPSLQYQQSSKLFNLVEWVISKTGYFTLLPALIIIIVYFMAWIPVINQANIYNKSYYYVIISILLITSFIPYSYVSSMLRWYLGVSLTFLITYLLFISRKKKAVALLYIFPLFVHMGMILPIVIIIINFFIVNKRNRAFFLSVEAILVVIFFRTINYWDSNSMTNLTEPNPLSMAAGYSQNFMQFNSNGILALIVKIVIALLYSFGAFLIINRNGHTDKLMNKMATIYYGFDIVALVLLPQILLLDRYIIFVGLFSLLIFIYSQQRGYFIPLATNILYCFASVMAIVQFFVLIKGVQFVPYIQSYVNF